jgi:2-keto-4-pentenoate hydratase/2-oxohepta-3-ene-1,7-dioic acid hydratase in catechol pathway
MKLGRISLQSADGPVGRIVAVHREERRVVDLAMAEVRRLMAHGASESAARRYAAAVFPPSMSAAIGLGERFLDSAREADATQGAEASRPLEGLTWLAVTDPTTVRDCLTFVRHIEQSVQRVNMKISPVSLELPAYYKASSATLIGHESEVQWPGYTEFMDYEFELGFVIGRTAHNLTPEEAGDCFFGLTIYNDFSARDIQGREGQLGLGPGKAKDFATALGPWIVTMDEFGGIDGLKIDQLKPLVRVNGEVRAEGDTTRMLWTPSQLIAYISQGDYLLPGDIVGSGTVGNGCGLEFGRRLSPGDLIELDLPEVGVLRNRIGRPEKSRWWPSKRSNPFSMPL